MRHAAAQIRCVLLATLQHQQSVFLGKAIHVFRASVHMTLHGHRMSSALIRDNVATFGIDIVKTTQRSFHTAALNSQTAAALRTRLDDGDDLVGRQGTSAHTGHLACGVQKAIREWGGGRVVGAVQAHARTPAADLAEVRTCSCNM
eukprot:2395038-Amphidinium_carterae.1